MRELESGSQAMRKCLEDCQDCQRECLETVAHCLEQSDRAFDPELTRLLTACAEICGTSAVFLALGTDLHTEVCAACAVVCEECADACERVPDDERLQTCAEACRRCAESCDEMSGVDDDDDEDDDD